MKLAVATVSSTPHPMMARLFARVADGVAGLDGALARNRAGACEYRFEQGRLAAWNGPTSATQRGPTARVPLPPFVAIKTSRAASRRRTGHRRGPRGVIV